MTNKRAQSKSFEHKGVNYKGGATCVTSCQRFQADSTCLCAVGDNVLLLNQADADAPFVSIGCKQDWQV